MKSLQCRKNPRCKFTHPVEVHIEVVEGEECFVVEATNHLILCIGLPLMPIHFVVVDLTLEEVTTEVIIGVGIISTAMITIDKALGIVNNTAINTTTPVTTNLAPLFVIIATGLAM